MIARDSLTGLVLAGGQASRMQLRGQPVTEKGLLSLHGLPLIALAQRYLQPKVGRFCISANRHLDAYAEYGCVIQDDPSLGENAGPLAGVASALALTSTPWLMVVPVDVPNLPEDLLPRLAEAVNGGQCKIAYASSGRAHPLCMLVHRDLLPGLQVYLRGGDRKVQRWQQANGAKEVEFPAGESEFFNINTQADLNLAGKIIPLP